MRRLTWRFWAALAAGLGAYGALGWWWSGNGTVEAWVYRVGLTAASVMPVLFAAVYAAVAKWWRWKPGSALTLAALSVVPTAAPLAYAFWADGGMLTQSWLAWLAVSGPCLSALALGWASWIWLGLDRAGRLNGSRDGGTGNEGGGGGDGSPGDARHRRPLR